MNRIVIFCDGYGHIEYVLQLILLNCRVHAISLVIAGFHDLFKFYQAVNEKVFHHAINVIYLEPFQPERSKVKGLSKIFRILPDIIHEKSYLREYFDKYLAGLENSEVFFFSRGSSGLKYYLLKKLSKKNVLVCVSTGPPYLIPFTPTDIVGLTSLAISRLTYGLDIAVSKFPTYKGFPYLSDSFMKKEVDRVMDWAEVQEMMRDFKLSQFKVFDEAGKYSVIYFDDDLVGAGYIVDNGTFERELTRIFDVLGRYFPEKELALKYHPGHPSDRTLIRFGGIVPSYIPAELLYNANVKMYLGIFSRSIANVEKGLAVSIVNLITFKSDDDRDKLREILLQWSKSKILFPSSLDEFERIVSDLKENGAKD